MLLGVYGCAVRIDASGGSWYRTLQHHSSDECNGDPPVGGVMLLTALLSLFGLYVYLRWLHFMEEGS